MNAHQARLALVVGLALGAGSAWLRPVHAAPPATPCTAPDDIIGAVSYLPQVAKVLQPGSTLRVLAIGSATMFGPEASLSPGTLARQAMTGASAAPAPNAVLAQDASDRAFPLQMAKVLETTVPTLAVRVTVRGGRGMTAADMLALLRTELAKDTYQLVLWQTGTVEAVRNSPPGEFAQILSNGAEAVEAAGANLVLIDPQYSRFLQTNSNLDPYAQALQQTAAMPGVLLFHRFELMRNWASDGQIDLERTPKADRKRVGDTLHACLGAQLARMVLAGSRS